MFILLKCKKYSGLWGSQTNKLNTPPQKTVISMTPNLRLMYKTYYFRRNVWCVLSSSGWEPSLPVPEGGPRDVRCFDSSRGGENRWWTSEPRITTFIGKRQLKYKIVKVKHKNKNDVLANLKRYFL